MKSLWSFSSWALSPVLLQIYLMCTSSRSFLHSS